MRRLVLLGCLLLAACAAPPLTQYTLDVPARPGAGAGLPPDPTVIEVARAAIPDELDTQSIVVRDGSVLRVSATGLWASRLSLSLTDRLTERLAARYPNDLITDRLQTGAPTARVLVTVNRLDVTTSNEATLAADWVVIPANAALPIRRDRARFVVTGKVTTDADVVALVGAVVDRLAAAIDLGGVQPSTAAPGRT